MKRLMIAAAMVLAAAAPAFAEQAKAEAAEARAIPVSYADLNVSQSDDAQALFSRLRYAATRACEVDAVSQRGPGLRRAIEECRAAALDEAVKQANSPEVSRLHSELRR